MKLDAETEEEEEDEKVEEGLRAVSSRRPPRALQVSETLRDCLESSPNL